MQGFLFERVRQFSYCMPWEGYTSNVFASSSTILMCSCLGPGGGSVVDLFFYGGTGRKLFCVLIISTFL